MLDVLEFNRASSFDMFNQVNQCFNEEPVLKRRVSASIIIKTPVVALPAPETMMIQTCEEKKEEVHNCCGHHHHHEEVKPQEVVKGIKLNPSEENELCGICYTDELCEGPCARLRCGHVFHVDCIVQLLKHGHPTLRMSFAFMSCPACKAPIDVFDCKPIAEALRPLVKTKAKVEKMALK